MKQTKRLQQLEEVTFEVWLREEAARLDLPMEEAWRQSAIWDALLRKYGVRVGEPLPVETIEAFLREFAETAAPEEDPVAYVAETLAEWTQEWDAMTETADSPDAQEGAQS